MTITEEFHAWLSTCTRNGVPMTPEMFWDDGSYPMMLSAYVAGKNARAGKPLTPEGKRADWLRRMAQAAGYRS